MISPKAPPKATPSRLLRIIDANLDRAREGLRLLEDIARFYLNDAAITEKANEYFDSVSKNY